MPPGVIAGIVVGAFMLCSIVVTCGYWLLHRRRLASKKANSAPAQIATVSGADVLSQATVRTHVSVPLCAGYMSLKVSRSSSRASAAMRKKTHLYLSHLDERRVPR
jgi:hypothetical protein